MSNRQQNILASLHDVLGPALHEAFLRAADLAKQTRTYLVVWDGEKVRHVAYDEIDEFVAERKVFKDKNESR